MEEKTLRVLMVEDDADYAGLIRKSLGYDTKEGVRVDTADRLSSALAAIGGSGGEEAFDLILLDLSLPDSRGIETFLRIRERAPKIPVLVLTGQDEESLAVRAIQEGAQDYIVKGSMNAKVLGRAVRFAIERQKILEDWQLAWQEEFFLATHDPMTRLPNRLLFKDRLNQTLAQASRHQEGLAVLYIDLDGFKGVNDAFGHGAGDELLRTIARRFRECVRQEDTIARLSGDEFGGILQRIHDSGGAALAAERILQAVREPVSFEKHEIVVTASIGISFSETDGMEASTLVKNADFAMYRAKELGGNRYEHYHLIRKCS